MIHHVGCKSAGRRQTTSRIGRQTDKQTGRQTDRRQTDRQTNRQKERVLAIVL
jgi:hypothetical protein